ncbi:Gfo/Idh/MocA family oxidoreductase [Pseudonocardia sp. RS11V-5]|uniref:Gfo/Idh/MocA family protein n=1 Tax=Pseudonocardia terrae TaxID=2905831 RepID=UPI001E29B1D3|nr:Gfo/Idh/MocA family oxidoreductase [Pseudonocardia terrae]MCE3549881.1 Gfo/Idh/MocA family oxidoreductase [Pseudonocardia terrae]
MTLRIGVVGASYAQGTHLPVYAELAAEGVVELVAVATAHRETADAVAEKFGIRAHVGFEALCADPEVDLVDVATRPSLHREMVLAALAAGKHVLCEAPLAPTVADGEAMAAAVGNRVAVVDMQSRFRPGLAELRRLVRDGFVGRVDNVSVQAFYPTFTQPAAVAGSGWCADPRYGASSLRVHGLHTTDLLRWTFGELSDVRGTVATREPEWPGGVRATSVDSAAFTARTAEGAVVSVHSSWVAHFGAGFRMVVHGSEGMLRAEAAGHTGHFPVRLTGARIGDGAAGAPHELVPPTGGATDPFATLIRAVATGDHADLPTFADGLAALRVAAAVEERS